MRTPLFFRTSLRSLRAMAMSLGLIFSGHTLAEQPNRQQWHIEAGAGLSAAPSYPGSDAMALKPFPWLNVEWSNRWFLSATDGLGVNWWRGSNLNMQTGVTIVSGRSAVLLDDNQSGPAVLSKVGFRNQIQYTWRFLVAESTLTSTGPKHATTIESALLFRAASTDGRLQVMVGPSKLWANSNHRNAWFQVESTDIATAPELESGIVSVGLRSQARYRMSDHWSVITDLRLDALADDANSPLIQQSVQPTARWILSYRL